MKTTYIYSSRLVLSCCLVLNACTDAREAVDAIREELRSDIDIEIDAQASGFADEFANHRDRLVASCGGSAECTANAAEEALGEAVAHRADAISAEGSVLELSLLRSSDGTVRNALLDRYGSASGPVERLAVLQLLLRTRQLDPRRLDDSLMNRFFDAEASGVERSTLLELHRVVGVSDSVGSPLADWCLSANRADALHCLAALGHADTASDFARVLDHLRSTPSRSLAMRAGDAVGRCGRACVGLVEELAASDEPWDRHAAYFAAARSPDQEVRDALAASIDIAHVEAGEAPYVERALGLEWQEFAAGIQGGAQ